jgi:hypothetical protein
MEDGGKIGLKTALAGMEPTAEAPRAVAEQMALLPLADASEGKKARELQAGYCGRGRPAGAKNKSSKEWADFLLAQYRSPLVVLAETYSRPKEDLAEELGISKAEAFKLQLHAARELAPYVHQKQPTAIDAGENGLIHLTINTGGGAGPAAAQEVGGLVFDIEENQQVINDDFADSVAGNSVAGSYGVDKAVKNGCRAVDLESSAAGEPVGGGDAA